MTTYRPKHSTIFLYDFVHKGVRHTGSTGCKTKREAEAVEARVRAEAALDVGRRVKKPITLDEAAAHYEDRLRANGKWGKDNDRWIASIVDGLGGGRYLSDITDSELRAHFARRAAKVSAASVNREIEVARPIWRMHARTHDIGDMPDWGRLRYAVAEKDPRELYRDEEERLWAALRADLQDFVRFALASGWRMSEVRLLRWADLALGERVARVKVKGGKLAARPLSQDMLTLIANQPKVGPFVFTYVCQKTRKEHVDKLGRKHRARLEGERYPFSEFGWRKEWQAALKAADVPGFRFHDLRHTRGTRILRTTGNLVIAQKALGHSSMKTTLRYAHASMDDVRAGLDASESRTIPDAARADAEKDRKTGES